MMGFWSAFKSSARRGMAPDQGSTAQAVGGGSSDAASAALNVIDWSRYRYISIDGGSLNINTNDERPQELPLALKEIKLAKKELTAEGRALGQQIREIRASHRDKQAHRVPSVRGGGKTGQFIRAGQAISKANDRSRTASAVRPLEDQKFVIDRLITALDHAALEVEHLIADAE